MKARVTYTNRAMNKYPTSGNASDYLLGSVGDGDNDDTLADLDEDKKNKYYLRMKLLGGIVVFFIAVFFFCQSIFFVTPIDNSNAIRDAMKTMNGFSHSTGGAINHEVFEGVDTTATVVSEGASKSDTESIAANAIVDPTPTALADLLKDCNFKINEIRSMKSKGKVIETSSEAKEKISTLQPLLRKYITSKYGPEPYFVEMTLKFPESMPDAEGSVKKIYIKLAPIEYVPYCVFYFLRMVEGFRSGAFHRWAGHVLQAMANIGKRLAR